MSALAARAGGHRERNHPHDRRRLDGSVWHSPRSRRSRQRYRFPRLAGWRPGRCRPRLGHQAPEEPMMAIKAPPAPRCTGTLRDCSPASCIGESLSRREATTRTPDANSVGLAASWASSPPTGGASCTTKCQRGDGRVGRSRRWSAPPAIEAGRALRTKRPRLAPMTSIWTPRRGAGGVGFASIARRSSGAPRRRRPQRTVFAIGWSVTPNSTAIK